MNDNLYKVHADNGLGGLVLTGGQAMTDSRDTIDWQMFEQVAKAALRKGIRDEGRKIGLSDLDEEATSLAYTFAAIARTRVDDVIAERAL